MRPTRVQVVQAALRAGVPVGVALDSTARNGETARIPIGWLLEALEPS